MSVGGDTSNSAETSTFGRGLFRRGFLWVVPQPRAQSQANKPPKHSLKTALGGQRAVKARGTAKKSTFAPTSLAFDVDEPPQQKCAPPAAEPAQLNLQFADPFSSVGFVDAPHGSQQAELCKTVTKEVSGAFRHSAKRKSFQDILQHNHIRILREPAEDLTPGPPLGRDPLWRTALLSADLPPGPGRMHGRPKPPLPASPPKYAPKPSRTEGPEGEVAPRQCAERVRRNFELMGAQRSELRELQGTMQALLKPAKQRNLPVVCG